MVWAAAVVACGFGLAGAARAEGVPFYGYSDYFGGPAVAYWDQDDDVQQTTRPVDGMLGFGIRTYSRGGPFWAYKPTGARPASYRRAHRSGRRTRVVYRKG